MDFTDKMIVNTFGFFVSILTLLSIGIISVKAGTLDKTGFVAAFFIGFIIVMFGGWAWFIILLTFHFVSYLFTKYRYDRKLSLGVAEKKGGTRTWKNVFSNGIVASFLAICYGLTSHQIFAAGYLGAISTSLSDTLATELGLLNIDRPRLITNLNLKVRAGTSGGITLFGEFAALLGSSIIALIALITGFANLVSSQILFFSVIVGLLGCNFDSLMGAIFQVSFKCRVCGNLVEERTHCGQLTDYCKGVKFIDNNIVNLVSSLFGTLVTISIFNYL